MFIFQYVERSKFSDPDVERWYGAMAKKFSTDFPYNALYRMKAIGPDGKKHEVLIQGKVDMITPHHPLAKYKDLPANGAPRYGNWPIPLPDHHGKTGTLCIMGDACWTTPIGEGKAQYFQTEEKAGKKTVSVLGSLELYAKMKNGLNGMSYGHFKQGYDSYEKHLADGSIPQGAAMILIDPGMPAQNRGYKIDMQKGKIIYTPELTTLGGGKRGLVGKDDVEDIDNVPGTSNEEGSLLTPSGALMVLGRSFGSLGGMKLCGLDEQNANSEKRAIIFVPAKSSQDLDAFTDGCIKVSAKDYSGLDLKKGDMIFIVPRREDLAVEKLGNTPFPKLK